MQARLERPPIVEHLAYYDLLWRLIYAGGRRASLFGERCGLPARQAFAASACGSEMPIVYFEVPLAGEPDFDLQVCIERTALQEGFRLPTEAPATERDLLTWLAGPGGADCTGVDLAFDLHAQDIESPQLVVLMKRGILDDAEGFFALTGIPDGAVRYRAAEARTPRGWHS